MSTLVLALYLLLLSVQCNEVVGRLACQPCACCNDWYYCNFYNDCQNGCIDGYWGVTCRNNCPDNCVTCTRYDICNECFSGYHGQSCQNLCSSRCVGGVCDKDSGRCNACEFGYTGDWCTVCDTNRGFISRNGRCSNCTNNCANCSAEGICIECKITFTGIACLSLCSSNCLNRACNSNGSCVSCEPGFYGDYCNNKCPNNCINCTSSSFCTSCTQGYYGYTCNYQCSNCLGGRCGQYNGYCNDGCNDGWSNVDCLTPCYQICKACYMKYNYSCTKCADGRYGTNLLNSYVDCHLLCSPSCLNNTCDQWTGSCTSGCVKGRWGTECSDSCPANCRNSECFQSNGSCTLGCKEGYKGDKCECPLNCKPIEGATTCNESNGHCLAGCKDGHYSDQCDKNCSINCLNASCDFSGKCIHGCSGDFVNDLCLQVKYISSEKSNGDAATIGGSVGGSLTLTIIVIVAAIVLFKRRRKNEQNMEDNHGNNAVVYSNMENRLQNCDTVTSAAERLSTAYEIIARGDDSAEYSALSFDANQSAAFLDMVSRSSEQVGTEKVQTIYEKPILEEDTREYATLEYDKSQTSNEYLPGHIDKKQSQSLSFGKGMDRSYSFDNKTITADEKAIGVRENDRTDYINTSLAGVSRAKKYP